MSAVLILIPAYEPDLRLVQLVRELRAAAPDARLLLIDDGSGRRYDGVFEVAAAAGAVVLRHPVNRGKGAALKRGFAWAIENAPGSPVVCADGDGQHTPRDILRVAAEVQPGTMVLGGRRFTGRVPQRSRWGNAISRRVFRLATGLAVHDTQTGLRGYSADLLAWLTRVEGARFEYESNLLFEARPAGVRVREVPIDTIYLDGNSGSHFRPVRDSARIYAPLLRYGGASSASAILDWAGVLGLVALTGNLLLAVVAARLASAAVNFRLNRGVVFRDAGDPLVAARRYAVLAAAVLGINYTALWALTSAGAALAPAKLVVEVLLSCAAFVVQRRLVFRRPSSVARAERPTAAPSAVTAAPPTPTPAA